MEKWLDISLLSPCKARPDKKNLLIVCNLTPNTDDHGKIWSHFIIKGLLNGVQKTEIKALYFFNIKEIILKTI